MPKLINAYAGDDTLANAFSGLAESFLANTPQKELARQKAFGLSRDNRSYEILQDAERAGGYDPNNAEVRAAIVGLDKPVEFFQAQRGLSATRYGAGDPRATNAYVGAGGAYSGTVQGTREAEANRRDIENLRTERQYQAAINTAENTPTNVVGPDGLVRIVSRRAAIQSGMTPVLSHGEAQGVILQNDTSKLSPDQRAQAAGYAPKNPASLWTYHTPDGRQGTTADGRTDVSSGAPLPAGTKTIKLEGPNADGLTGKDPIDRELIQNEIHTKQTVAAIDRLTAELAKPDAATNIGYVGRMANTLNGLRAQAEAVTVAAGGLSKDQAVQDPVVQHTLGDALKMLQGNPQFNARLQQMGIDNARLVSQIHDLAYTMARTQDPSGRISKDDVLRASQTIGATLMDPKAGIAVLTDLKDRTLQNYSIREQVLKNRFPNLRQTSAGAPASPQAGAPQPNVVDWTTYFGAAQ